MPELMDMPIDTVIDIFSLLDYEHAQNFRFSCKALEAVYQDHRIRMRGPKIDALIHHDNNNVSILIKRVVPLTIESLHADEDDNWKPVLLEDLYMYCKNAELGALEIKSNQVAPMELSNMMVFCKSINKVAYKGDQINQQWLDTFDHLVNSFGVVVNKWPGNLFASTKMQYLVISSPLSNFNQISNVIHISPCIIWYMEVDILETAIEFLQKIEPGQIDFKLWSVSNIIRKYERSDMIVSEFIHQVERVSKNRLVTLFDGEYIEFKKSR